MPSLRSQSSFWYEAHSVLVTRKMKTPHPHPLQTVLTQHAKLLDWANGNSGPQHAAVVGALGELVASTYLGIPIVSHVKSEHDLSNGLVTIEVKTGKGKKMSGKICDEVVQVDLERSSRGQIHVKGIDKRPHPDPGDGHSHWLPVPDFTSFRIL